MAVKESYKAACFKDEWTKEDPLSTEVPRQCESKMIPTKLPMFFIDFAAPNIYPPLPGTKALISPHPFLMKSPFQLRFFLS